MSSYTVEFISMLVTFFLVAAAFVHHRYGHWKRRNVPYLKPIFPVGNNSSFLPKGISMGIISKYFYDEFTNMGCKLGGVFLGLDPQVVVVDPEYAKDIMTKDFAYFIDRGIYKTPSDAVTVNIFAQEGAEWKLARAKFTSLFTSGKMRKFLEKMKQCSEDMVSSLQKDTIENADVNILEAMACYTTDIIGSVLLGIECNSFKDKNAEFRKMGRKLFEEFSWINQFRLFCTIFFPKLAEKLGVSNIQPQVSEFYIKTVTEIVNYREENKLHTKDFLQMLIDLKNSEEMSLTMNELIGQTFLFFAAGYETSSTTATLALFELGQNLEAQNKLRKEIEDNLEKYDKNIPYEAVMEMEYLNAVFNETLRKWPPVTTLTRVCTQDYTFPNSNVTVEKNSTVIIPVLGFHRDPKYYPDPMKWDPQRFMNKEVKHVGYFPFGEGPRMCIGMRFGQMQGKIGLIAILRNFQVSVSPSTVTPLELDPDTFILHTKQRVYLKLKKI